MTPTKFDEAQLTDSLRQLAGQATASPEALDAVRGRYRRNRRNRARLTTAAGGALALLIAVAAVNIGRFGSLTEVSTRSTRPGAEGESSSVRHQFLPAFLSVHGLKPQHIGMYEGPPEDGPDRWVQSSYRGEGGRQAQLTAEHKPPWTIEERAAEREGQREDVSGPRGTSVTLISDRGRYWGYWVEGEWQFELDAGAIPSRDEALEILHGVTIDAAKFEELKLALRDNVHITLPGDPPVVHVVTSGSFEGTAWRVTELARPEGQRCLGLEPERGHRWFCLPSDAGAFSGDGLSIPAGPKVQVGDYWLYAALVDVATTVRVHTETADGTRDTVTLAPAPLSDGGMGVAVGFIPTTVETITTELVNGSGETTHSSSRSMGGG